MRGSRFLPRARDGRQNVAVLVAVRFRKFRIQLFVILSGTVFFLEIFADFLLVQSREYARIALAVEVAEHFVVSAVKTQSAALSEKSNFVALVQVLHGMRDYDYGASFFGEFAQKLHHF